MIIYSKCKSNTFCSQMTAIPEAKPLSCIHCKICVCFGLLGFLNTQPRSLLKNVIGISFHSCHQGVKKICLTE